MGIGSLRRHYKQTEKGLVAPGKFTAIADMLPDEPIATQPVAIQPMATQPTANPTTIADVDPPNPPDAVIADPVKITVKGRVKPKSIEEIRQQYKAAQESKAKIVPE